MWDEDTLNGWVNLATPVTEGWHNLEIKGTAGSFTYFLDGTPVYTDNTVSNGDKFTTAFVQAFNFGADYSVLWDNINLTDAVPDAGPGALGLLVLGGVMLLPAARKLKFS